MAQQIKSAKRFVKKTILIIVWVIILIPVVVFLIFCAKMFFYIDLSQDYREIEEVENIIFYSHEQLYKRSFWGLQSIDEQTRPRERDKEEQKALLEELKQMIDCENTVDIAISSTDERYILYREIHYNYYKSDMTDDEYCYYRIYDNDTQRIITIYKGYRQWFNLDWK